MTRISRIKTETKQLNQFVNNFINVITLLENKNQVSLFFNDLLTHTELKMLTKRIQIAKMLLEGYDYKAIKGYVKVTDSTISTISNKLENGAKGLKSAILKLQKEERNLDDNRTNLIPDLKEKYPTYYLPDRIYDGLSKQLTRRKKRKSISKYINYKK